MKRRIQKHPLCKCGHSRSMHSADASPGCSICKCQLYVPKGVEQGSIKATERISLEELEATANVEWKAAAMITIRELAESREDIIASDVLRVLESRPVQTHDLRAIGAMLHNAQAAALIERTDRTRNNPVGKPTLIWRSRIYIPKRTETMF